MKNKRFSLSIRSKLLLVSSVLLIVPWIGVRYVQDMETFLRHNQEDNLLARAKIVAAVLQSHTELFKSRDNNPVTEVSNTEADSHMYVRALHSPIQLDGYADDWEPYQDRMKVFDDADQPNTGAGKPSLRFRSYVGTYKGYLYALFQVTDDHVVYRQPNTLSVDKSDHLKIVLRNPEGELRRYIITTISPGWVNAYRVETEDGETTAVDNEFRIKGEWQQTATGYNIEIRIALSLIGNNLAFFIADVDDPASGKIEHLMGTSPDENQPGSIIIPSPKLDAILHHINEAGIRTWIVDRYKRVIALTGNINQLQPDMRGKTERSVYSGIIRLIYQFLLKQPTQNFQDDRSSLSRLKDRAIQHALEGKPTTAWRQTPDKRVRVLTATYPVKTDQGIIGAVAIEETSNSILILENQAMEILINLSVLTFLIAVLTLLAYATRLSWRIRQLRNQADGAIGSDGRIVKQFNESRTQDEIGDLSRSFSDMLTRLSEYNRYLESMSSRLSHELRTPTTIVRSSLDNLETADTDADRQTYIERAREGMQRLSLILTRMNEATRLEQTLQSETRHEVDLPRLLENCVAGYRTAYPETGFELAVNVKGDCLVAGTEDLVAQCLDKLVSNAMDFHSPDTAIRLSLDKDQKQVTISVTNQGPVLPEKMQHNLFESMVSVRDKRGDNPHLGLGLYIVRLIVEFHHGHVSACNLDDGSGVRFSITLPLLH